MPGDHRQEAVPARLRLRRAEPSDTDAIAALLAAVFPDNPKTDPAVLAWQYWDNPFAPASSYVWDDEGQVVCHYAGFGVPGRFEGRRVPAAKGADAATAPPYRGLGLFHRAARAVYDDLGRRGIPLTFVTPNPNSLRGELRAGITHVADAPAYVAPLDDSWLAERFRLPRPLVAATRRVVFGSPSGPRAEQVDAPPAGLDALEAVTARFEPFGVVHDTQWWQWRYQRRPKSAYRFHAYRRGPRLAGAAASVVQEAFGARFLFVLDLLAADDDAASAVVRGAAEDAEDAVGVALVALPGTRLSTHARAAGLRRLPRPLEPRRLHVGVVDNAGTLPPLQRLPWSVAWSLLDHL